MKMRGILIRCLVWFFEDFEKTKGSSCLFVTVDRISPDRRTPVQNCWVILRDDPDFLEVLRSCLSKGFPLLQQPKRALAH